MTFNSLEKSELECPDVFSLFIQFHFQRYAKTGKFILTSSATAMQDYKSTKLCPRANKVHFMKTLAHTQQADDYNTSYSIKPIEKSYIHQISGKVVIFLGFTI
jgi:hypothetical protein